MHKSVAMFLRATATRRMPERIAEKVLSKQTEFPVQPFGLLQLRVSDCSPKIVALDHTKYPDSDRVVVSHCSGCFVEKHQVDFIPTKGNDSRVVSLSCTNGEHAEYCGCTIQIPNHLALDISANGDADVKITGVEPTECHISSEYSSVHLHKVKTKKASIFANNGSVEVTGNLTGNVSIKTGVAGFVRADRLQGSVVKIDTFEGPINCKAIYGDTVQLSSRHGNITANNIQGQDVNIWSTHGNVDIGSIEGDLSASLGHGNLSANVARTGNLKVECLKGNVRLGLDSSVRGDLKLESPYPVDSENVSMDSKQEIAPGETETAEINVVTREGRISLRQMNWIDTVQRNNQQEKRSAI
ncbi:uncharacterized protein LOC129593498 [Paramacrobiotus metropolitanus]|uniref:uncharacterized protein LOC129593498 n=1 Tax=Paramacrobiotus metropolitanus TaxID=2943436 RepID=UPI0024465B84|nr:uncharacterized protein LOC129593498 [Paramacrobiotus metropolitanus]